MLIKILLVSLLSWVTISAQVARTELNGTVTDEQGKRIPSAKVHATNTATGLRRETETNSLGTYVLPDMETGTFSIEISKDGFAPLRFRSVKLEVGRPRTLDITLNLAGQREEMSVTEAGFQLDRVDATVGAPIEQKQVDELPINGRNWSTLTALVPGAVDAGAGDQRTIRFAGHGLDDNNLTLDGVDATAVFNQMQREYVRLTIPLESIDQFDVKDQTFGADVEGGTSGAQVAVVSPSGTNSVHGNVFDYFRNQAIEARTPFSGASPNPFLLNQFGGAVGGPIVRNRLFFYAAYEGLRQRLDGSQIGLVPSPSFIAQATLTSPALLPILTAYPAGTSPATSPNVWNYNALGRQIDNEDSGMIRLDYHLSSQTTSFVRFNSDEAVQTIPAGQLISKTQYDTKFNNGAFEVLHVFSPSLVNEFKFGVNQDTYVASTLSPVPYTISVSGFSSLAGTTTNQDPSKAISLLDDVSWSKGSHTLKFGFEFKRLFLNQGTSSSGALTYTSTANFLSNQVGTASYTSILPLVRQRKNMYWAYAEDEWRVTPTLTINAGVRYNVFNALSALNHQAIPFDFATCGGFCPSSYSYFHPRYDDVDPRIGIAWSHHNTVVRVGAGIYHTDGQEDDQNLPISNTVSRYSFNNVSFPGLAYPLDPFLAYAQNGGLGVVSPRDLDRNRKDNYVASWTLSLQQTLPGGFVATLNYLGNKGTDVLTTTYTNLAIPGSNVVPYPAFGAVSWRGDVGNSTFEALQFNLRRTFRNGFLLSSNYMWSHSINDGSIGGGDSDTPQDSFCRSCDKASSDFDVRQLFNLSTVYALPFGAGKQYVNSPGILRTLLGNWEMSAIGTAQTGLPVNITVDRTNASVPGLYAVSGSERPDYVFGQSLTPAGGSTANHWINPAAFARPANGTFGNLGRNAFRAPGITQLDLAVSKFVSLTERCSIRFRADVFNLTNRAQYGAPNADVSASNFGVITTTLSNYATGRGTPRELQFSIKILF
ncbi:MAG TPA: carboxypeptidase regulatory-like domain-containing protein [Bryobacteraceae bacterium]|nr:carboxypeptidase regulatory-like domain-containing protein [Bryobacteraceae bacterium]